jgi:hypothetical protein
MQCVLEAERLVDGKREFERDRADSRPRFAVDPGDRADRGLDPEARRSMLELIKTLAKEKTLIVSSHNLADVDEVGGLRAVV